VHVRSVGKKRRYKFGVATTGCRAQGAVIFRMHISPLLEKASDGIDVSLTNGINQIHGIPRVHAQCDFGQAP
jgi:hypothetical protein